jgi:hypothetical protein
MPLSCQCDSWEFNYSPGEWDFSVLNSRTKKPCMSCEKEIKRGEIVIEFKRYRLPYTEVDWDEATIPKAPGYLCEVCGEIFLNLRELGFECLHPSENMMDALADYQDSIGPIIGYLIGKRG